eukprot:2740244-Pyramimonas_sp.AAC.1
MPLRTQLPSTRASLDEDRRHPTRPGTPGNCPVESPPLIRARGAGAARNGSPQQPRFEPGWSDGRADIVLRRDYPTRGTF